MIGKFYLASTANAAIRKYVLTMVFPTQIQVSENSSQNKAGSLDEGFIVMSSANLT